MIDESNELLAEQSTVAEDKNETKKDYPVPNPLDPHHPSFEELEPGNYLLIEATALLMGIAAPALRNLIRKHLNSSSALPCVKVYSSKRYTQIWVFPKKELEAWCALHWRTPQDLRKDEENASTDATAQVSITLNDQEVRNVRALQARWNLKSFSGTIEQLLRTPAFILATQYEALIQSACEPIIVTFPPSVDQFISQQATFRGCSRAAITMNFLRQSPLLRQQFTVAQLAGEDYLNAP